MTRHDKRPMEARFKAFALAVLIAALLPAIAWYVISSRRSPAPIPGPTSSRVEVSTGDRGKMSEEAERVIEPIESLDAVPEQVAAATNHPADESGEFQIHGRIVVRNVRGEEFQELSGSIYPRFLSDDPGEAADRSFGRFQIPVAVILGRFTMKCPRRSKLTVRFLELGGERALLDSDPIELDPSMETTLRAHRIEFQLHVVDAASHRELPEVDVVRTRGDSTWTVDHPGSIQAEDVLEARSPSPVTLTPARAELVWPIRPREVWVRSPGYAWTRTKVQFDVRCDEQTIELVHGADLVVSVVGDWPPPLDRNRDPARPSADSSIDVDESNSAATSHAHVRIWRAPIKGKARGPLAESTLKEMYERLLPSDFADGRIPARDDFEQMMRSDRADYGELRSGSDLIAELPPCAGDVRIDSLPVGEMVATAEVGAPHHPLVLARAVTTLSSGQTAHVSLVLERPVEPLARLKGSLVVPPGWNVDRMELIVRPVGIRGTDEADALKLPCRDLPRAPGRDGTYAWDAGNVRPGIYSCSVEWCGFSILVPVRPDRDNDVDLVLRAPIRVVVHVVDADTNQVASLMSLSWIPASNERAPFRRPSISLRRWIESGQQEFVGAIPSEPGRFNADSLDWYVRDEESALPALPGGQEVKLRVHRAAKVELKLACKGHDVEWPEASGSGIQMRRLDEVKARTGWWSHGHERGVSIGPGGSVAVTIPPIPGFEPVSPIEIEVPEGAFLTRIVELREVR